MNFKHYPEQKYTKILTTVDPYHYQITSSEELLAKEIFPSLGIPFIGACVATGGTTLITLHVQNYKIPIGSRIVHLRWFREYQQLSKAYDILVFPVFNGDILFTSWKKGDDHHLPLLKAGGLEGLIETNHLPAKRAGHLNEYGAYVPVVIDFATQEREAIRIFPKVPY